MTKGRAGVGCLVMGFTSGSIVWVRAIDSMGSNVVSLVSTEKMALILL